MIKIQVNPRLDKDLPLKVLKMHPAGTLFRVNKEIDGVPNPIFILMKTKLYVSGESHRSGINALILNPRNERNHCSNPEVNHWEFLDYHLDYPVEILDGTLMIN